MLLSKFYSKENYIFVFDKYQKDFYLSKGLMIVDSDINPNTNKLFWIFDKSDTNYFYGEWLTKCKNRHMA